MDIIGILQSIAAPLSLEILLATLFAGLFFGAVYSYELKLPKILIIHQAITGIGFIVFLFLFRVIFAFATGAVVANPWGWVGIGILWFLYCTFIRVGEVAMENIQDYRQYKKKRNDILKK